MPELPYMPFYVNDYLGDTQAMTAEQHGAYLLLIFHYWNSGGPISADDSELSLIARIDSSRWPAVRTKLERYFQRKGNEWVHERIERELQKARTLVDQRKKAGLASAEKRKNGLRANGRSNEKDTSVDIRASDSGSKILDLNSEVLNTSQVENPSSLADAKPAEPETPAKPSVDSPGMRWTETPEERTANDARLTWAEEIYFRHPKQVNKHASIVALCRLYDVPGDRALFECHYDAWIDSWAREGAKFTPALVKSDGSGFLPDGAWRKPPPRAPAPKPARGSAFLAAIEESERQVGN